MTTAPATRPTAATPHPPVTATLPPASDPAPPGPPPAGCGAAVLELLLADGRFPGGGFAHSGGLEAAIGAGAVTDAAGLGRFLQGRIHHGGVLEAWLAAGACRAGGDPAVLEQLEAEAEAHQPVPALREASRAQGRGLRRSAALLWPQLSTLRCEVQPVVLGAVCGAAGLDATAAARLAVYGLAMTVAGAAVKLAALDMADALAEVARLADDIDTIARRGASTGTVAPRSAVLVELRAEPHRAWEVRLFAS